MTVFNYVAMAYKQRPTEGAPKFCIFHAKVSDVLKWAAIQRLNADDPVAIQREPKRTRILGIKKFFERDLLNTIPTAVVVTLDGVALSDINCENNPQQDGTVKHLSITVPDNADNMNLPGLVIDGQHRLKGIEAFNPETHVNIVALLDATVDEKAFQFLVINNKGAKVAPDHIRALNLNYSDALTTRLQNARLNLNDNVGSVGVMDTDPDSPFKGLIKWPNNVVYEGDVAKHTGFVAPSAIETSIGYIKSLGIADLDDSESIDEFFINVWSVIKSEWTGIFNDGTGENKGNKLLDKVSIICLTEFIVKHLRTTSLNKHTKFSLANPEKVKENTKDILDGLAPEFWTVEWKSTSYDTRAGRDQIIADIEKIYGNFGDGKAWSDGLEIIAA
jgi:DGQHR domain-containing protein